DVNAARNSNRVRAPNQLRRRRIRDVNNGHAGISAREIEESADNFSAEGIDTCDLKLAHFAQRVHVTAIDYHDIPGAARVADADEIVRSKREQIGKDVTGDSADRLRT